MSKIIQGLRFQPWISKGYGKGSRLLLVGESLYKKDGYESEDEETGLTTAVVKNHLKYTDDMLTPYFRRVGFMFNKKDPKEIWENVAFANLIQNAMSDNQSQPTAEDIATIKPAFVALLNALKPERVLVLSKRLFDFWLPEENASFVQKIERGERKAEIWRYEYDGGSCLCMGINHPSRMLGNTYLEWVPIINEFMKAGLK